MSSVLLSWLLSVGTVLCEDMILERVGLQGPGIPSIEQYILGGTHSFVGTFGWTYSLVLMLLWFTVLFFPWLVKTGRIKIKNPLALPSNVVTHLTPAATRV
ncbi:MAG: hypothetical protein IH892_15460 [Planctomycetes bacterium]|nr:hypothetical protein [Planctomycetota bacterium]